MKKFTPVFVFLMLAFFGAYGQKTITDTNYSNIVQNTDKLILIDFYADWCPPCKLMQPVIESIANEYSGQVIVGKLNTDYNNTDEVLSVSGLPTFLFIKNNRILHKIVGAVPKETLIQIIEYYK